MRGVVAICGGCDERHELTVEQAIEFGRRVLKVKGVELKGATPLATISAMLAVENKKPDGLFVRTAPSTYTLREP